MSDRGGRRATLLKRVSFALLTTVAFFALLELVLWLAGVAPLLTERDPFQGFSDSVRVYELDAERGVYRTVRRAVAHSFHPQEFAAEKTEDGFRVFVLGGSSSYGFPWGPRVAFARLLEQSLAASFPERSIEVVNASAMSYGSHRLRILVGELLEYDADLLVLYSGHNEFVEQRFYADLLRRDERLDPLRALLHRWRLFSALQRWREEVTRVPAEPEDGPADVGKLLGLDVERDYADEVGGDERAAALARFADNLLAIAELAAERGVEVVLCTVPSNLRGWVPNQSFFGASVSESDRGEALRLLDRAIAALDRGDPDEAVTDLVSAAALAPAYAEIHYRLGQAHERTGSSGDALDAYRRARDLDGKPARAPTAFNAAVRDLAARNDLPLVDAVATFGAAAPHGLPGFDVFEDYVHPKPRGHQLIARDLWRLLLDRGVVGRPVSTDESAFWAALGLDGPTLDGGDAPLAASGARTPALLYNLAVVLENQGRIDEAMESYHTCTELDPRYYTCRTNLGRLLFQRGHFAAAAEQYRRATDVAPDNVLSWIGMGQSLRAAGRHEAAIAALERATDLDPRSARAWDALGVALGSAGLHERAEAASRRALELDPGNSGVEANLGWALLLQGRLPEAETTFRDTLSRNASHRRSRNGLAAALGESGRLDEAERLFREALRDDPNDRVARGGLARVEQLRAGSDP